MEARERLIPVYNHDGLLHNLALHLRDSAKIHFREPNLNGWAMGGDFGSPDLLEIPCSYSRFTRKVFEVKFSQADLLSDLRAEKWTKYLPICDRMIFAVNHGIDYETHLRPLPVGIMVFKNGKWRTVRAAPPNKFANPWPENVWMALLFGRMNKKVSPRLERLEREAERLKIQEIKDLRLHAWDKLRNFSKEIREKESDLKYREEALREREEDIERVIREEILQDIAKKMQVNSWQVETTDKLLNRWAKQLLRNSFDSLKIQLESKSKEGCDG